MLSAAFVSFSSPFFPVDGGGRFSLVSVFSLHFELHQKNTPTKRPHLLLYAAVTSHPLSPSLLADNEDDDIFHFSAFPLARALQMTRKRRTITHTYNALTHLHSAPPPSSVCYDGRRKPRRCNTPADHLPPPSGRGCYRSASSFPSSAFSPLIGNGGGARPGRRRYYGNQ